MIQLGDIPSLRYLCSCTTYKFSTLGLYLSLSLSLSLVLPLTIPDIPRIAESWVPDTVLNNKPILILESKACPRFCHRSCLPHTLLQPLSHTQGLSHPITPPPPKSKPSLEPCPKCCPKHCEG